MSTGQTTKTTVTNGKIIDCPMCNGSGVIVKDGIKYDCWGCGGSGKRDLG